MDSQEVDKLLEKLSKEIEGIEPTDEKGQALLKELAADIQELRAHSDSKKPASSTLKRLEASIAHFEVTYPELTSALSRLSSILSNAGI